MSDGADKENEEDLRLWSMFLEDVKAFSPRPEAFAYYKAGLERGKREASEPLPKEICLYGHATPCLLRADEHHPNCARIKNAGDWCTCQFGTTRCAWCADLERQPAKP